MAKMNEMPATNLYWTRLNNYSRLIGGRLFYFSIKLNPVSTFGGVAGMYLECVLINNIYVFVILSYHQTYFWDNDYLKKKLIACPVLSYLAPICVCTRMFMYELFLSYEQPWYPPPPRPDLERGYPHPDLGRGYPPFHPGQVPGQGGRVTPNRNSIAYVAGGMPLAFTHEDFLVS